MTRSALVWLPLLAVALGCSCSASEATPDDDDNDEEEAATPDAATPDAAASGPAEAKRTCEDYIRCMSEIEPSTAGGLVSLYGDASACWKGSEADAEACRKACQQGLDDETRCSSPAEEPSYAVACSSNQGWSWHYHATFDDGVRAGSTLTLRPFSKDTDRYEPDQSLAAQPDLVLDPGLAARSNEPFTFPGAVTPNGTEVRVTSFSLSELSSPLAGSFTNVEMVITAPTATTLRARCEFLSLAVGATFP